MNQETQIKEALAAAYKFITQPAKMERSSKTSPAVITYRTHDYNKIEQSLRDAMKNMENLPC